MTNYILWFKQISKKDIALVGGKNASLGEMFSELTNKSLPAGRQGINVPDGFALTTKFYWQFIKENNLEKKLKQVFNNFNPQSIKSLQKTGKAARNFVAKGKIPNEAKKQILAAYKKLCLKYGKNCAVAVRSSGVAEDSPTTSFAGQFETYLNVRGEKKLLKAINQSLVSTFTDRAIAYREQNKIPQLKFALSVGVQKMVRSDLASSGIIFTLDTETGFDKVIIINAVWGVGEMIVKGKITPDEFIVSKPLLKRGYLAIITKNLGRKTRKLVYNRQGGLKEIKVNTKDQANFALTDNEVLTLAKWAMVIEKHYRYPQDIEWAKHGKTGQLFIVQSRPETIQAARDKNTFLEYELKTKKQPILQGIAVGSKVDQGKARIITNAAKISEFKKDEVLVAKMTDPDWLPAIRLASAIVTNEGSRVCHAAIVSRELGIPAVVGTKNATQILKTGEPVTVDCSTGQGKVFEGLLPINTIKHNLKTLPKTKTKVMVNIGIPQMAFKVGQLPCAGVGLARTEFVLAEKIKIHPLALYHYKEILNPKSLPCRQAGEIRNKSQILNSKFKTIIKRIDELTIGYKDKERFFVDKMAEGMAQIATAFWPRPVIIRLSDFKTNEYRALIGGDVFEPEEQNPMLGLRGASRYYDPKFQPGFEMECQAIKKARVEWGLKNIWLMVPFCRTIEEGKRVLDLLKKNGLENNREFKVIVMAEIPSNIILADRFLDIFDGMSIGSNDLTQLVLGIDRDNAQLANSADERNKAVKTMIAALIKKCRQRNKYIGICGDAPSTFPDFTKFLVKQGIESISVNPDALVKTILNINKIEKNKKGS